MKKIIVFGIVSLILLSVVLSGCKPKLQVCPDEKIINEFPTDRISEFFGPSRTYYILEGKRAEISDFDRDWVEDNCNVTVLVTQ